MGSVIIGLIFLVGVVVVGGILLNFGFGIAGAGKHAVAGLAIQNSRVRSSWRGLPLPVDASQLRHKSEVETSYVLDGGHLAMASQWFENNWVKQGYPLVHREDTHSPEYGIMRHYQYRDERHPGTIDVLFIL
ncbi:MAG TPA: hypothetical protein VIL85_06635, partial [Thermomicrobiales bacterium]